MLPTTDGYAWHPMTADPSNATPVPEPIAISPFKRQLPNILTSARMGMVIAFAAVLELMPSLDADPGRAPTAWLIAAAAIFTIAALTDALDGYLARRWRVISRYGRIMDPLADKLLVLTAFVYLASPIFQFGTGGLGTGDDASNAFMASRVAPWMVAVILGRELAVTSLRGLLESEGADASANAAGKAKMVLQSVCVPVVLVLVATASTNPGDWAGYVISGLVWATVAATAASAWPYIRAAVRHTRAA